jgi:predicted RNA-binding protein YlqC (UPF0109 family)
MRSTNQSPPPTPSTFRQIPFSGLALRSQRGIIRPMQVVTDQIRNFLQYIAVQFIEFPAEAQLKVTELGPKRLRFKLVLRQSDVALLIGRNGFSASAIRGVLKSITEREDVNVSLQIHSTEEEIEMQARERH